MPPTDREQKLQALADENSRWAEAELQLIEAIQEHKRRLKRLPEIIRLLPGIIEGLKEERKAATAEMNRTGAEHDALEDALEAEADRAAKIDKDFMDWANAQTDAVTDEQATTRHPSY